MFRPSELHPAYSVWNRILIVTFLSLPLAAQEPLTCTAQSNMPMLARIQGLAEQTGDVRISCSGGVPTALGQPVPRVNISLQVDGDLALREINRDTQVTEALLMVNPPNEVPVTPTFCPSVALNATCAATGGNPPPYDAFFGTKHGPDTVTFHNVPLDAPGAQGELRLTIRNIRINATSLRTQLFPQGPMLAGGSVAMSFQDGAMIDVQQQQPLFLAFAFPFDSFNGPSPRIDLLDAVTSAPLTGVPDVSACSSGTVLVARFTAQGSSTFTQTRAGNWADADTPLQGVPAQDVLWSLYFTESGFTSSAFPESPDNARLSGTATQGTRFFIRLHGLPHGVRAFTTIYEQGADRSNSRIRRVSTDRNADGPAKTPPATFGSGDGMRQFDNGTGDFQQAVFEVTRTQPGYLPSYNLPLYLSFPGNGAGFAASTIGISTGFGPVASDSDKGNAPVPRFADLSSPKPAMVVRPCPK